MIWALLRTHWGVGAGVGVGAGWGGGGGGGGAGGGGGGGGGGVGEPPGYAASASQQAAPPCHWESCTCGRYGLINVGKLLNCVIFIGGDCVGYCSNRKLQILLPAHRYVVRKISVGTTVM